MHATRIRRKNLKSKNATLPSPDMSSMMEMSESKNAKLSVKIHLKLRYYYYATFALLSRYSIFCENSPRHTTKLRISMKRLLRRRIFMTADEQFRLLMKNVKDETNQVCQLLIILR
uniref:Uncharacterized protein n=1 Tax=Onchocerca volvulus TaxID=6282 RepID=A0A8R1Y046_ONCVO